jgi:hypothetical protein
MKILLSVVLLLISLAVFAQEEEEFYDFGTAEGLTIFAERPRSEFQPESPEAEILTELNGNPQNRERFIREDLLEAAGFRRSASVRFRKSTGAEKVSSVLLGAAHAFTLGAVPMKPFAEIEYARLPPGEMYQFEAVIQTSELKDLPVEVRTALELEYMLQVQFGNGIVSRNWNLNYYTEENIAKFEKLAMSLPESPPSIYQLKDRYLNEDLPRIKAAWERYKNPSENNLRALQNLDENLLQE